MTYKEQLGSALQSFFAENPSFTGIHRIEIPIPDKDPLGWLYANPQLERLWWKPKQSTTYRAGLGIADCLFSSFPAQDEEPLHDIVKRLETVEHAAYIGGFRFPGHRLPSDDWKRFGYYRFVLPLFELSFRNGQTYFSCHLVQKSHLSFDQFKTLIFSQLEQLRFESFPIPDVSGFTITRDDSPHKEDWRRHIETVRSAIHNEAYKKVVLARKTTLQLDSIIDPAQLLWNYDKQGFSANQSQFIFQVSPTQSFVGSTPEWLYKRDHRDLISEAVAGTKSAEEKESLLQSSKDLDEHHWVAHMISEALKPLCTELHDDTLNRMDLPTLSHLYREIKGILKSTVDDVQVLQALYPTPAVSGYPVDEATSVISVIEPFDRGWYSGIVGCVQKDNVAFAVAIRSALCEKNTVSFFSGAGITQDSHWETEWNELETKLYPFFALLGYENGF